MKAVWLAMLVTTTLSIGCSTERGSTIHGSYVWGAEVNAFRPCEVDEELWVTGPEELLMELREEYRALDLPPYGVADVEVRGTRGPALDCGFCDGYEGSFQVEEMVSIRAAASSECG